MIYKTIESMWFDLCKQAMNGEEYTIDRGSFKDHKRRQLHSLTAGLTNVIRPLAVTFKGQCISTDEQCEEYFQNYLVSGLKKANEEYTYGERIAPYLKQLILGIETNPRSNQHVLSVSKPHDFWSSDPPCLRSLDWKVYRGFLNLHAYFRSWDLARGLPLNMGGLVLLNEYVSELSGIPFGTIYVYCSGAHIYEWDFNLFN